ncbi:MAG: APC family permease [Mycobacteriales bacterium]
MSILRTKSVEEILAQGGDDTGDDHGHLRRKLGPIDLIGFGIGVVIGTGIFTLTGIEASKHAGPAVLLSFIIGGVVSLLAALCYAELASSVPTAGSAYTYAYATIGEIFAWIIGWDLLLEFALGAASVARGWSAYLANLFGLPAQWFTEDATINVGALAIVVFLGIIAAVGVKQSSWVAVALVAIKVTICVFVIVAGLFFIKASNYSPFIPPAKPEGSTGQGVKETMVQLIFGIQPVAFGIAGVLSAAAVVFFAYTGFEAVANMSEETRKPGRDLPLGLLGTLGIATVLYVGVSFVVTGMLNYTKLNTAAPIADAFDAVGAHWAANLVSIAAVCGLTSVILVDLVAMSRIGFAVARDGMLPPSAAKVHPRFGTPIRVTVAATILVAALATFVKLEVLADLVSIGTLAAFVMVSVAVPILRRTKPDLKRRFRVPLNPVIPILSALACLYLMLNLTVETWIRFVVWLVIGFVLYFGYGRRRAAARRAAAEQRLGIDGSREHSPVGDAANTGSGVRDGETVIDLRGGTTVGDSQHGDSNAAADGERDPHAYYDDEKTGADIGTPDGNVERVGSGVVGPHEAGRTGAGSIIGGGVADDRDLREQPEKHVDLRDDRHTAPHREMPY